MKYGYARVSSTGQDLDVQIDALNKAGCEIVRTEKVSGTSMSGRDELKTLLSFFTGLMHKWTNQVRDTDMVF